MKLFTRRVVTAEMDALFRNVQAGLHSNKCSQPEFREEASGAGGVQVERSHLQGTDAACDGGRCSQRWQVCFD